MAKMYPFDQPSPTESAAEVMLYWQLKKQLSDDFSIIHSVPWLKSAIKSLAEKGEARTVPTGEVDFLILHAELGILAIEVKGGGYKYTNHSFVSIKRGEKINAIGQIRRNAHGLAKWVGDRPALRIRFGYAVAFPDSSFVNKPLPPGVQDGMGHDATKIVIGKEDIPTLAKKITQLMTFWKAALDTHSLGEARIKAVIDIICPETGYIPSWKTRIFFDTTMWLCMTDQQANCIARIDKTRRMVVKGWPGTGKTLLAIEAVKRLAARKEKVLVIAYNVHMAKHIRSQLADQAALVDVFHFHDMCRKAAAAIGTTIEADGNDHLKYAEVLGSAFAANYFGQYNAVVIDEGQALCYEWHATIARGFSEKRTLVFCDDAQVFDFENGAESRQMCQLYGSKEPFVLTHCLRSPKAVNEKLQEIFPPNFDVHCPRPFEEDALTEIVTDEPFGELRRQVRHLLEDEEISPRDIVIIYPYWDIASHFDYDDPLNGITRINAARFRGLEAPVVIFFAVEALSSDTIVFSAYSRATTKCIAIFGYNSVRLPNENTYIYKVAEKYRELVDIIRESRSVSSRFSTIAEEARKLKVTTANIYWFDPWNSWVVETLASNPAGWLWVDYLSTLDWPIIYWKERDSVLARLRPGNQRLYENETSGGEFELLHCGACGTLTPHKKYAEPSHCSICTEPTCRLISPSEENFRQLESFDVSVTQSIQGLKNRNPRLPISLVAMGLCLFASKRENNDPLEMLTTGGKMAYRAAHAIIAATVILQKQKPQNLKELVKRYYDTYVTLSEGGLDEATWHKAMANAVSTLGQKGLLIRDSMKKGHFSGRQ